MLFYSFIMLSDIMLQYFIISLYCFILSSPFTAMSWSGGGYYFII